MLDKRGRIHQHGRCQTPHFVLAFAYGQTSHPQLFSGPDGLGKPDGVLYVLTRLVDAYRKAGRIQMTIALQNLNKHLTALPAGPISNEGTVRLLLYDAWDDLLIADDGGFKKDNHIYRVVNLVWDSPCLTFEIERHGGVARGSIRAEIQKWTINVQSHFADYIVSGLKQMRPPNLPVDMAPIVTRVTSSISDQSDDPWITWLDQERSRCRLNIPLIIPDQGPSQAVRESRKRLNEDLAQTLAPSGWALEKANYFAKAQHHTNP